MTPTNPAGATPRPWQLRECQPHPGDGPNSLPRWALFHEEFPDTTGQVGTGIVSYSCDTFAYLSAREANAALIVESVNSHAALVERVNVLTEILGRVLIHSTQETHGVHLVNALKDAAEAVRGEK